jgi:hypothetical protein
LERPVIRPVDARKLGRRPVATETQIGPVTIPEIDAGLAGEAPVDEDAATATVHTEIQALLMKLGSAMGLSVYVAANDRSRMFQGVALGAMPGAVDKLPTQFAAQAQRIVSLIDVLWLDRSAIVAAFEVESTTSIYSGLLRMADLLSLQPNVSIPLYVVAPDDRRDRVLQEVNRPTFSRLNLADVCAYIPFSAIRDEVNRGERYLRYLRPEFLANWPNPASSSWPDPRCR